jgi:hypothetical protein
MSKKNLKMPKKKNDKIDKKPQKRRILYINPPQTP